MAIKTCLLAGALFLLTSGLIAQTQVASPTVSAPVATSPPGTAASATTSSIESVARVPGITGVFRGVNAGVNYAGVHNSATGWYSVMNPALSYAFSSHLSADVSSSIYFKRRYLTSQPGNPPSVKVVEDAADGGDTLFGFHGSFWPGPMQEIASFTLSAPTGDATAGLGTGHVTYDFSNHLEGYRGRLGMFADFGVGNSSVLFNNLVERNYSTLGGLAHFMAGAEYWMGEHLFVESLMYEQLPFGSQHVFADPANRDARPGPPSSTTTTPGANEDNGITTYLGIPLGGNVTLSGYYSRSLRRHTDTVSFGATWVLRGRKSDSIVDKALREAEKAPPEK